MKKFLIFILIGILVISTVFTLEIIFGGYFRSLLLRVPQLQNFKFLRENYSVVVRENTIVRVTENEDYLRKAEQNRESLVTIVRVTPTAVSYIARGIVLTSDGVLATLSPEAINPATDTIVFANNDRLPIVKAWKRREITFLKTESTTLIPYNKGNSIPQFSNKVLRLSLDAENKIWYMPETMLSPFLDSPEFNFGSFMASQAQSKIALPGSVGASLEDGSLLGLFTSSGALIPSWYIEKQAALPEETQSDAPQKYGMKLRVITAHEAQILGSETKGLLRIAAIETNAAAARAGLLVGDVIIRMNDVSAKEFEAVSSLGVTITAPIQITVQRNGAETKLLLQ